MAQPISTKRTSLEIIHEILQLSGRKKTDIMYRTSLTYPQTIRYLELMTARGLLCANKDRNGRTIFEVTEKGREVLVHLTSVVDSLVVDGNGV